MTDKTVDKFDYEATLAELRANLLRDADPVSRVLLRQVKKALKERGDVGALAKRYDKTLRMLRLCGGFRAHRFARLGLVSRMLVVARIAEKANYVDRHELLEGRDFTCADLSGLRARGLSFRRVDFHQTDLSNSEFLGVDFNRSSMEETTGRGARFVRCEFDRVKCASVQFAWAEFVDCHFVGAELYLDAGFGNARFENCCWLNGRRVHGRVRDLGKDHRGYKLVALRYDRADDFYIRAGCREFFTVKDALAHWGALDYHGGAAQGEWFTERLKKLVKNPDTYGLPEQAS